MNEMESRHPIATSVLSGVRAVHVCISAFFSSQPWWADALRTVVAAALRWRLPIVHITVVTNNSSATAAVLEVKGLLARGAPDAPRLVQLMEPSGYVGKLVMSSRGTSLTWFHRVVWEERLRDPAVGYSVFVYLEHDIEMRWEQLVAWAEDEAILSTAPLTRTATQFKRGFYRWYVRYRRPTTGASSSVGGSASRATLEPGVRKLDLADGAVRYMADGNPCFYAQRLKRCQVRVGNRSFVGLNNPYSASVVMTRTRLVALLSSDQWLPNSRGHLFTPAGRVLLGPRETAASGDAYLNFTEGSAAARLSGCANAMLVPFYRTESGQRALGREAGLRHLVQRYPYALPVDDCLTLLRAKSAGDDTTQHRRHFHLNYSGLPCAGCMQHMSRPVESLGARD